RSTPARFSPSSAVISWMRRSRCTSSWEYRRVPFGERLGSIRPRASYMRSVCGCICASSAATEIMNTPRLAETFTRATLCSPSALSRAPSRRAMACPGGLARLREQPRAHVAVHDLRELIDGCALLLVELARNVDHEAVVQIPAIRARATRELRRAGAAQALHRAVRRARPHAQRLGALERRHLHLGPAQGLGDRQRDLDLEVVALAFEHRRGGHMRDQIEVARRSA